MTCMSIRCSCSPMITVLQRRPLLVFPSSSASPEPPAGPALAEATGVSSGQTQGQILFLILHGNLYHAAEHWFQDRVKSIACVWAPFKWGLSWTIDLGLFSVLAKLLYYCLRIKINIHVGLGFRISVKCRISLRLKISNSSLVRTVCTL